MLYSPAVNMAAEPKILVAHREDLWWLLAEACQLEHMIMCQYLFAEWTLKDKSDGLSDEQSEAIERWRGVLRGIAIEEMLHLALVANVMSSIGAAPYLGRPNFPQRSGYFPESIQLDLMPFGEQALKHFLFLERPEGMERQDAVGFVADGTDARAAERVRGDAARAGVPHRRTSLPRDRGRVDEAGARPWRASAVRRLATRAGDA